MNSQWSRALVHPLNLAMLPLALAAGACAAWWLLPAGIGLWLMMVIAVANDSTLPQ